MSRVLTPEHLAKLAAGRANRKPKPTLRNDFAKDDQQFWEETARKYNVRLPHWNTPTTMKTLHDYFKKLRIDSVQFLEYHNAKNLSQYVSWHKTWPARSVAGLILEYKEYGHDS